MTGMADLRRALRSVEDKGLLDAIKAANENAAELVVDAALPNVPFRTGGLRRSVQAKASVASGRAVAGDSAVPYAAAIHWGRKRGNVGSPPGNHQGRNVIAGRPFLWNAARQMVPRIEPAYCDEIMRIIERAFRSADG